MRARPFLIVATPLVAVATLALGLRVGAGTGVRAAVLYGAPPAAGRSTLVWQLHTLYEDRGVREVVQVPALVVTARAGATEAAWKGGTNAEGVAEVTLDLPGVKSGDALVVDVREAGARDALAAGTARTTGPAWGPSGSEAAPARPTRREGAIALDVFVRGQRLIAGTGTSVWVRATDAKSGAPEGGVVLDAEADQGLSVGTPRVTACANGWAEIEATAVGHLTGLVLRARAADGRTGEWFGPLVVSPGAAVVEMPLRIAEHTAYEARVSAPPVRKITYVEVNDVAGRAFAAALALEPDAYGSASTRFAIPPLAAGRYWLVTAHDARGAEGLGPGTLARPFDVASASTLAAPLDRCTEGPALARATAFGFTRFVALDGFTAKRGRLAGTRARGIAIAVASLVVAALLEAILLVSGALDAKARLAHAMEQMDDVTGERGSGRVASSAAGGLVVGLLLVLLGFGLLAALVTYRAP